MNNPTFELIQSYIESYDKIWNEYRTQDNTAILSIDLKSIMPINLKTPAKLKFFKTFGDSITEKQFIHLLKYQTTGADFVNLVYIIKYYNLEFDTNGMIIWTDECAYTNFKEEAINNWYIWNTLTKHAMFGKYMKTLLEFKLQCRLESSLLPTKENFKNDLYFVKQNLVNATNEKHHLDLPQKELDTLSIALHKMNGISIISFYTTAFVDKEKIKKDVYTGLCNNVNNSFTDIATEVFTLHDITNVQEQASIKLQINMIIRSNFKKNALVAQRQNIRKFGNLLNSCVITSTIKNVLNKYLVIINKMIHEEIKDNYYLKCYTSTLLDILLSSCLNDFNFSQDYDQIVIAETLVDDMQSMLNCIKKTNKDNYITLCDLYNNLNDISNQFINNSSDYVVLYGLKLKSLMDPNNTKVINLVDVYNSFKINNNVDKKEINKNIITTCAIDIDLDCILIS